MYVSRNSQTLVSCGCLRILSVLQIDEKFSSRRGRATCGTTSTTIIVYENTLYVAHCGDSRAVLVESDGVVGLTRDHKPADPSEAARIQVCTPSLQNVGNFENRLRHFTHTFIYILLVLYCCLPSSGQGTARTHAFQRLLFWLFVCMYICALSEALDAMPLSSRFLRYLVW